MMIRTTLRTKWIVTGFLILFISLFSYVYYTYLTTRAEIIQQVDNRLLNAALSVKYILGDDYHDSINAGIAISNQTYQNKNRQLSEFANALDIAYVYSMILKDGEVLFSSSSYTQKDKNTDAVTQFLDSYPEATKANVSAFYSTEPIFETSKDHWGRFKSVFVPHVSKNGSTYLTGADIKLSDLNQKLNASMSKATVLACFFFFITTLVIAIYIYLFKRSWNTDSSSGFANHIALDYFIKKSTASYMQAAVIWVNEIEDINNFYGTEVGDKVMKNLLYYFAKRRPTGSHIFRLTTNKIVLIGSFKQEHTRFSELIQNYDSNTPLLSEPLIYITLCAGVAGGHKGMLLENAHIAALQAKQGRFCVINYSAALQDVKNQYEYNVEMAKDVRDAFDNNRIVPYFQPVHDLNTHTVIQYECLPRMITRNGHPLLPEAFLKVVNRTRMDAILTRSMISQCIERYRATSICWSVIITAHDILDPSLTEYLANELKRYPLPHNITLALREIEAIASAAEVTTFINTVKQLGVKVIIDNFGAAYSDISTVLKLDVDGIKLDGSIIKHIINDEHIHLYIENIANFAKQLNLQVIAKCVDSKPVVNALLKANIHLMQGDYFTPPSPQIMPDK